MIALIIMQTTLSLSGCAAETRPEPPAAARVIVRFKPSVTDPTGALFLQRLAAETRVDRIEPIRSMSGNAYVMTVVCATSPNDAVTVDPCAAAIARLAANDSVAGIERDGRARHH